MIGTSPPAPSAEEVTAFDRTVDGGPDVHARILAAADPRRVLRALQRIADATGEPAAVGVRLAADEDFTDALVRILDASRYLGEHLAKHPEDLSILVDGGRRTAPLHHGSLEAPTEAGALRRWRRTMTLHVAARDLCGVAPLEEVGADLAAVADACLSAALVIAGHDAGDGDDDGDDLAFAVIGMGKLGGQELNYASDVDVLFVHDGAAERARRMAQGVIRTMSDSTVDGRVLQVDADLRPEGRSGPLSRTLVAYRAYWERWAEPWEFQALLKARLVAGDGELGRSFAAAAAEFVFPDRLPDEWIPRIRRLKARAEEAAVKRGLAGAEVKRGPGGIRDIEFAVQLLQLVHGRTDPALRVPATLPALAEMARAGFVGADDAGVLDAAYRHLRTVEHRLQLEDDRQTHTVPSGPVDRARLARVLGYRDRPEADAREQFERELRRHQTAVRSVHERLFYRPLLEAFSGTAPLPDVMSTEAALERLSAFGFLRRRETAAALVELTHGLSRTSRLMRQLLPLMLGWLSEAPDPDLGLVQLRHLATFLGETTTLVVAFRDNPVAAQRLCRVIGTSRLVGDILRRHPEAVLLMGAADAGGRRTRDALRDEALRHLELRADSAAALRRFKRREFVRIAARDILGIDPHPGVELAFLADACLSAALDAALAEVQESARPRMAVIAFGRYGGEELSYASDLDVMFVHAGGASGAAEKVAERTRALVCDITAEGQTFRLDADLRPEGKKGLLSRTIDGYRAYWTRWAETWEFQALLRARPAAGDPALAADFMETAQSFSPPEELPDQWVRDIRHMKARVERERMPAGDDPAFHLKLGPGSLSDVEFTVQLLQLRHAVVNPSTTAAIDTLVRAGPLGPDEGLALLDSYRFCNRVRDRLFLIVGRTADSLPRDPGEGRRLADSLGLEGVAAMREAYRRVTRRARAVVDRHFWEG